MMGRTLPALALLAGLLFPSFPGDFASSFVRAWRSPAGADTTVKNGLMIDPNGATVPASTPGENGLMIDPDG
jgi:hypothetical protein